MYVHPRIIPFAILGMIAMFMVAIFLITDSRHIKKKKIRFKNYVIFIIPLIMIFLMQSISANSSIKTDDINTNSNGLSNTNLTYDNSEVDSSDKKTESDRQDENNFLPYTVEVLKKIMFICKKIYCAIFS